LFAPGHSLAELASRSPPMGSTARRQDADGTNPLKMPEDVTHRQLWDPHLHCAGPSARVTRDGPAGVPPPHMESRARHTRSCAFRFIV